MGKTESTPEEPAVDFISLRGDASQIAAPTKMTGNGGRQERADTKIKFNPENTQMIAYGIDCDGYLLPGAKNDTMLISKAFIDAGVVLEKNTYCYFASDHAEKCTLSGMKESVCNACKNTGENGLIILFYAGHSDGHTLTPKGFTKDNEDTWLTEKTFCRWLSDCGGNVAGVVCILDCCYAEGLFQERLSATDDADCPTGFNCYIIAASSKSEEVYELPCSGSEHHSLFSLSLKYYGIGETKFKHSPLSHSMLPLSNIYDKSNKCCTRLSCLLECNPDSTPYPRINPMFQQFRIDSQVVRNGRSSSIQKPRKAYLNWLKKVEEIALKWLEQEKLLNIPDILMAALCTMAYAIGKHHASHGVHEDSSTVFCNIKASIKRVTEESYLIALTQEHKTKCEEYHKKGFEQQLQTIIGGNLKL